MSIRIFAALLAATSLAACGNDPSADQYGLNPQLPEIQRGLFPNMKISEPTGWNGDLPTVPEGFQVEAIATDLKIPRQTLILPNGDILIAEGKAKAAPPLRPKDFIAGMIKKKGVKSE